MPISILRIGKYLRKPVIAENPVIKITIIAVVIKAAPPALIVIEEDCPCRICYFRVLRFIGNCFKGIRLLIRN